MQTFFQRLTVLPLALAYAGAATAGFCDVKGTSCDVEAVTYTPANLSRGPTIYPDFSTLDLKPYIDDDAMLPVDFVFDRRDIDLRKGLDGSPSALTVFELGIRSVNDDGAGSNTDFRVLAMKIGISASGKPDQLTFQWRDRQIDWAARGPETSAATATAVITALPLAESTSLVRVVITPADITWSNVYIEARAFDGASFGAALVPAGAGFKMPPDVTWVPGQPEETRVNKPVFLRAGVLGGSLQRPGMISILRFTSPDVVETTTLPIDNAPIGDVAQ